MGSYNTGHCGHILLAAANLPSLGSRTTEYRGLPLEKILCETCGGIPFYLDTVICPFCDNTANHYVRITLDQTLKEMIEEMFGEEIKDYEPDAQPVASLIVLTGAIVGRKKISISVVATAMALLQTSVSTY